MSLSLSVDTDKQIIIDKPIKNGDYICFICFCVSHQIHVAIAYFGCTRL